MEFTPFAILHNVIKIRNNSEPPHHYKQNIVYSFHKEHEDQTGITCKYIFVGNYKTD
jgi:hypothetical protein